MKNPKPEPALSFMKTVLCIALSVKVELTSITNSAMARAVGVYPLHNTLSTRGSAMKSEQPPITDCGDLPISCSDSITAYSQQSSGNLNIVWR